MTEIAALQSFGRMQRLGMRQAVIVDPTPIVESTGFDDECSALPFTDRVAKPGRRSIRGKMTAIRKDLPKMIKFLKKDHSQARRLNQLEVAKHHRVRNSMR